jgi:hypothetical protein
MSIHIRPKVILSSNKSPFNQKAMKQPLFLLLAILTSFTAPAQQQPKATAAQQPNTAASTQQPDTAQQPDTPRPANYTSDSFRLQVPGRRIALYAFCTPYSEGRAIYFRKDQDEAIHRLNYQNLSVALADNPASMHQLRIAHTDAYLSIGLFAGGAALTALGFIVTENHDRPLNNAYAQAYAKWQVQSLTNPSIPAPTPPHTTALSPLVYIGIASTLSTIFPINGGMKHRQKAIDIYNGAN